MTFDIRDDSSAEQTIARAQPMGGLAVLLAGIVMLLIATGAGFLIGQTTASTPDEASAEAGFARDMATHHAQAVEMALLATDRSSDPRILGLARDIAFTQQHQMGQMRGWLDQWGLLPTGLNDPMAWMGHPTTGLMPGMATAEELTALQQATGAEADQMFLTLMIRHHEGALPMAVAILDRAENEPVRRLASSIQSSQRAEVGLMRSMLDQIPSEAGSMSLATPEAPAHQHETT